jgi:uncharacterized protein HemX
MSLLAVPIVAVLALFLVLLSIIIALYYFNKFKEKLALQDIHIQSNALMNNEIQQSIDKIQQEFEVIRDASDRVTLENSQVSKQLEHRIKNLQHELSQQQQQLAQWQENQGQDKFYNRAFKLAEKGAGIDEIISECELPRAEVEMLLSVYQQRNSS